ELDIAFKKTFSWEYGPDAPTMSEYDFESVALHELGHGHQLGHVINSGNVMHYAISNGVTRRDLQKNDTACGNYVMRKSTTGVCSGSGMTLINQVDCMVRGPLIFRSKKSGKWNELTSWEYGPWNGSYWHDTIILPSFYIDSVIIRNGHTIEITDDRVITRTTINNGGILKWSSGKLFMDNGINRNLIIENGGTFIQTNDSTIERKAMSNIKMDEQSKLITSNKDGLAGIGSVYFISPYQQSFIFNKSGSQNAGSGLPSTCKDFEVDNGTVLSLQKSIDIIGTLKITNGIIKPGAYSLSIGNSTTDKGSLSYTTGYIEGTLTRWFDGTNSGSSSGLFPLGENNEKKFVTVEYSSAPTSGGTLTATFEKTSMGGSGLPIAVSAVGTCSGYNISNTADAYWRIDDGNGLTGGTYDISIEAEGFDGITDLCELALLKRSGMGSWGLAGTPVQTGGTLLKPIVKVTGATGWSNFGFGGGSPNPLPITLSYFNAKLNNDESVVHLSWTTVSEINNDYFEVQKSIDGITWNTISIIDGAGNSQQENQYSTIDKYPNEGINYYRLKQVDFNGEYTLSSISNVILSRKTDFNAIKIFPNPTQGVVNITNLQADHSSIVVMTIEGKIVNEYQTELNSYNLDIHSLPRGIYFIKINSGGQQYFEKLIKE
ncbi:MAG: T9SS type A sorting domain-containing protein, partial [Bacteroidetes bacterium]|nr:T9SS type A sorting domain-containing protein [Bacteroidota bacterium]